jgi:pimeloyl-ACP methyl ester carboxylesterase
MLAVMKATQLVKPIVIGHSGAGPVIISFAVNFPDQLTKLVLVDSQMNRDEDAVSGPTVGNAPTMFASIEACMERFARIANTPRIGLDRERATQALIKMENGYMLKRDPDNGNRKPIGEGAAMPRRPLREMWAELGMVKTPMILIRGTKSDRYPPETVERFTKEYPHIPQKAVDSQHDVARMAPDAMVAHVREFIGTS